MEAEPRRITFRRHFQQTSHSLPDPPLQRGAGPQAPLHFDLLLCSPYLRCRQSALLLNPGDAAPMVVDPRLSEFQGHKTRPHTAQDLALSTQAYGSLPDRTEQWSACAQRLEAWWAWALSLRGDLLVVTHGIVVRYFQLKLRGATEWRRGRDVPYGGGFTHTV